MLSAELHQPVGGEYAYYVYLSYHVQILENVFSTMKVMLGEITDKSNQGRAIAAFGVRMIFDPDTLVLESRV